MRRVLHRLFFGVDVPEPTASEKELQSLAATLVPQGRGWGGTKRWWRSKSAYYPELRVHALLTFGAREVRFERVGIG